MRAVPVWAELSWGLGLLLVAACAGGQSAPAEAPTARADAAHLSADGTDAERGGAKRSDSAPADESRGEGSGREAKEAELEGAQGTQDEAQGKKQASDPEPRQVIYRVTPEGLLIEVAGVRFQPQAEAVKHANGGYGIRLKVKAQSIDDQAHVLLSPKGGPLALAATIYQKNGSQHAQHGDTREGNDREFVMPGGVLELTREWPSGTVRGPLWWGQKVRLDVGLWGLGGAENSDERPVRKLFVVDMVGGANARAVITPPQT